MAEVGPLQLRRDLPLVEGVAELVQRADQRLEAAVLVAGRDARVAPADGLAERMRRDIDAPAPALDTEPAQGARDGDALRSDRDLERRGAPAAGDLAISGGSASASCANIACTRSVSTP